MISTPISIRRHPAHLPPANLSPVKLLNGPCTNSGAVEHAAHRSHGCRLESVLRETGRRQLQDLGVVVEGRVVIIEGRVDTYFLKQIAQESLRPHLRGMTLRNRLIVSS
ncbi:hypothetical protein SH528x_004864 [Novipirellula sp. SH528]|uniref:hypothetical protein n=1 Tax=Novipirellula sp. SH528 TaxID=3454466 RepID=UPI003FA15F7A